MRFLLSVLIAAFLNAALFAAETKIAVLSDIHVSPGDENGPKLRETIAEINASDAELVIITGDLTNRGSNAELDNVKEILDTLEKPYYAIPGNHETNWSESAARRFPQLFGAERFAFRWKNLVLIGLSSGPYLKMGDGIVRSEDLAYLREKLAELAGNGEPVLLFIHYPLAPELSNGETVAKILKREPYRILAVVSGHTHQLFRREIYGLDSIVARQMAPSENGGNPVYNILITDGERIDAFEKETGKPGLAAYPREAPMEIPADPPSTELPEGTHGDEVFDAKASVFTGVAVSPGGVAVIGTGTGELLAFNAHGELLWQTLAGPAIYSTPVFVEPGLFAVGTVNNRIMFFRGRDGSRIDSVKTDAPVICTGAADGNNLFIGGGSGKFFRFEAKAGQIFQLWENDGDFGTMQGTPALTDHLVIFGAWDTRLYALERATGAKVWEWNNGNAQVLFSPGNVNPAVAKRQVIIVAPDRFMTAIRLSDGMQLWRDNSVKFRESLGVSTDGSAVYAKTMDGELVAVATGKDHYEQLWKCDLGFGYDHAPCPVLEHDGIVYAGSRRGLVAAVDAKSGTLLWRRQFGTTAVNAFTADSDGGVWFSLIEGTVFRIMRNQ